MSLDTDALKKVAKLAHLNFKNEELIEMSKDLNAILKYTEQISELNTENIIPMKHPFEQNQHLRADISEMQDNKEIALNIAPNTNEDFFIVPQVIEQKGK